MKNLFDFTPNLWRHAADNSYGEFALPKGFGGRVPTSCSAFGLAVTARGFCQKFAFPEARSPRAGGFRALDARGFRCGASSHTPGGTSCATHDDESTSISIG